MTRISNGWLEAEIKIELFKYGAVKESDFPMAPESDYLEYKRQMFNRICQASGIPKHILEGDSRYSRLPSRILESKCRELICLPDYELRGFEC